MVGFTAAVCFRGRRRRRCRLLIQTEKIGYRVHDGFCVVELGKKEQSKGECICLAHIAVLLKLN